MPARTGRPHIRPFVGGALALASMAAATLAVADTGGAPVAHVIFGGDRDYPPFERHTEDGPSGFNVELARAVAASAGVRARIELRPWDETIAALRTSAVDVAPMFRSDARAADFRFSDPFLYVDIHAYGRPALPTVTEVGDLAGRRVAVVAGSYTGRRLAAAEPSIDVHAATTAAATLRAVESGKADYALLPRATADELRERTGIGPGIRAGGPPLWSVAYVFAVRRDSAALARWLEQQLDTLVETGRYREIRRSWNDALEPGPTSLGEALQTAALVIVPMMLVAGGGLGWSWSLRRKVQARTEHLAAELDRRREAEREARFLATHDRATGLARRPQFAAELARRIDAGGAFELVVLKLSELGAVTRTFGHDTGAAVVERFARRLRALDAGSVGYFGGRTFAATVAPGDGEGTAACLSQPIALAEIDIEPVVRAGIAQFPDDAGGADELLRRAETALAATGHHAAPVHHYAPALDADPDDLALVRDFRRDGGAGLGLVLQPQIDLASGRAAGAEALVRWHHPRLGAVSPARFVPLLERAGLIGSLTLRMIDLATSAAADLRRRGMPCRLGVNISAHDLIHGDLACAVAAALERNAARPGDLCLELTETSLAADRGGVHDRLAAVRALGVGVSVDDFGTGYASLAYLTAFPLDEVKIDRLFVHGLLRSRRHAAVVHATLGMAREMGLRSLAEGIEDGATLDALHAAGCDLAQGFHVGMPMALEDFIVFVGGGRTAGAGTAARDR